MADYTACHGEGCLLKQHCYRHRIACEAGNQRQSYFLVVPYDRENHPCPLLLEDTDD